MDIIPLLQSNEVISDAIERENVKLNIGPTKHYNTIQVSGQISIFINMCIVGVEDKSARITVFMPEELINEISNKLGLEKETGMLAILKLDKNIEFMANK